MPGTSSPPILSPTTRKFPTTGARVAGLLIIISIEGIKSIHLSSKLGRSPHRKGMGPHMGWTVPLHLHPHLCQRQGARREMSTGYHQVTSRLSRGTIRCRPRPLVKPFGILELGFFAERTLWKWQRGERRKSVGAEWSSVMTRQFFRTSTCSHREGLIWVCCFEFLFIVKVWKNNNSTLIYVWESEQNTDLQTLLTLPGPMIFSSICWAYDISTKRSIYRGGFFYFPYLYAL